LKTAPPIWARTVRCEVDVSRDGVAQRG
jgi:hypothetical protein